jgi:hypothetical protein
MGVVSNVDTNSSVEIKKLRTKDDSVNVEKTTNLIKMTRKMIKRIQIKMKKKKTRTTSLNMTRKK